MQKNRPLYQVTIICVPNILHGSVLCPNARLQRERYAIRCRPLCVPGMGMILWGVSPLYLIWKEVILTTLKVLAESKAWEGDRTAERSWSANLRADVQKLHIKAEPQGESAQHDEAHPDLWGMVNAAVVQGKIMFLPGEICQPKRLNGRGGTEPAKARVNMAEVSRGREPRACPGERSEGSVIGRCS